MWLLAGLAAIAAATEFRMAERVVVARDEIVEDELYAVGRDVRIDGTVVGDVLAAAESISVRGRIDGDLHGAARVIEVTGTVTDDARLAGEMLRLAGTVADDVVAVGFGLEAEEASEVGGSLALAGYQLLVDGHVAEDVRSASGAVRIDGDVDLYLGYAEGDAAPPDYGAPTGMPRLRPGLQIVPGATIPVLGDLLAVAVMLLGLGAMASLTVRRVRMRDAARTA